MEQDQDEIVALAPQPGGHSQNVPFHPPEEFSNRTDGQFHLKKILW
jgi:hypothetical protein